ncbi:MAG: class I SAM-dependent methyltransferase [Anaerolineales bacterium]
MDITQEQLENAGYDVPAAPRDAWRNYDEHNPVPRYFDFDWLSSRHPDLYHKFALSSVGLMDELNKLIDLTGLEVIDIGAGTGRTTLGAARKAKKVTAIDPFGSVLHFGRTLAQEAGFRNVEYIRAHCDNLPFPDNSFDASICAWAFISHAEAWRVLKPGGYLIDLLPAPGALCGELTPLLAKVFPHIVTEIAPAEQLGEICQAADFFIEESSWNGVPVTAPIPVHDFTYVANYADCQELAAILGRLYGPEARRYILKKQRPTLAWRLRIVINRVRK